MNNFLFISDEVFNHDIENIINELFSYSLIFIINKKVDIFKIDVKKVSLLNFNFKYLILYNKLFYSLDKDNYIFQITKKSFFSISFFKREITFYSNDIDLYYLKKYPSVATFKIDFFTKSIKNKTYKMKIYV